MTLYQRIKQRREELDMSQEVLAKKLGYKDRSTIARIENGENDITQSKIEMFAKALDTSPAYLMGWEAEQSTHMKANGYAKMPLGCDVDEKDLDVRMVARDYGGLDSEDKETVKALIAHLYKKQQR